MGRSESGRAQIQEFEARNSPNTILQGSLVLPFITKSIGLTVHVAASGRTHFIPQTFRGTQSTPSPERNSFEARTHQTCHTGRNGEEGINTNTSNPWSVTLTTQ